MTTHEKSWQCLAPVNIGTASSDSPIKAQALVALKNALINAGMTGKWTIYGCCGKNGGGSLVAPSSLPDTTDRWLTSADIVDGSGATTAQAWVILYNSTLGVYLVIAATGTYSTGSVMLTYTAPALNGTNSQYRPTMTAATGLDNEAVFSSSSGTSTRRNLHFRMTTQGHFFATITTEITTYVESVVGLLPVEPSRAADTRPLTIYGWTYGVESNQFSNTHISNVFSGKGRFRTWQPLSTTAVDALGIEPYMRVSPNYPFTEHTTDACDGACNDFPLFLYDYTAGSKGIKGRVIDFSWAPTNLNDGDTDPASGSVTSMVFGPLWVPADRAMVW